MYTIGQKLYCVPATKPLLWSPPLNVTITAIGRKWVTISHGGIAGRFLLADKYMTLDGGKYRSPGRCYLSREDYEAEQAESPPKACEEAIP
jgi:hypothetical protein